MTKINFSPVTVQSLYTQTLHKDRKWQKKKTCSTHVTTETTIIVKATASKSPQHIQAHKSLNGINCHLSFKASQSLKYKCQISVRASFLAIQVWFHLQQRQNEETYCLDKTKHHQFSTITEGNRRPLCPRKDFRNKQKKKKGKALMLRMKHSTFSRGRM